MKKEEYFPNFFKMLLQMFYHDNMFELRFILQLSFYPYLICHHVLHQDRSLIRSFYDD